MTQRFKNAIDALVYAFFNDTLAKGNCAACAVGTMVAGGFGMKSKILGEKVVKNGIANSEWHHAFCTEIGTGVQKINPFKFSLKEVLFTCGATGYDILELARVEKSFESSTKIHWLYYEHHTKAEIMEDQYRGLCAVVDVLCEIEGMNQEESDQIKAVFDYSHVEL